ncbi:MAG: DUF4428 domain-containing protein [Lachnospiraceae bacterium]|nr:DUF4428 domain-containing protein [Lachnospiraceae bacterium]
MGIFGKIFEKKECDICGGEIGLLGNRKLEDGNCCKECAKKLSPWFDDRRHSTVDQIKEQLVYRAKNEEKLANFRVSQVIGDYYKMYIEEVNGVPSRFLVTDADSYMDENPDIIEFKDLMSCTTDIRTEETELKQEDSQGNEISYNPPRYETEYDFYINMQIANNPYFDDIRFQINSKTVTIETRGATTGSFLGMSFSSGPVNVGSPLEQERYQKYVGMCQQIEQVVQRSRMAPQFASAPVAPEPAPVAQSGPKFCPNCGAPCDGGKFCQSCGSQL